MSDSDSDSDDVPLSKMIPMASAPPVPAPKPPPPKPAPAPAAPAPAPAPAPKKAAADSSDDELPLSQKRKEPPAAPPAAEAKKSKPETNGNGGGSSSANGSAPPKPAAAAPPAAAAEKKAKPEAAKPAAPKKRTIAEDDSSDDDSSDEEEAPLSQKKKAAEKPKAAAKPEKASSSSAAAPKKPKVEAPAPSSKAAGKAKAPAPASTPPPPKPKALEEGEDGKAWYEQGDDVEWKKGQVKWTTLEWNGVLFPPLYEAHGVEFRYAGEVVPLTPEQEEVATMYASMLQTAYVGEDAFKQNFMASWRPLLKQTEEGKKVKDLGKCDFSAIAAHLQEAAQAKKELPAEDKKKLKAEKDKEEEPYLYAIVDGRKEKLGNFRVEPPGLFRGRGQHPKMGKLKARVVPEDITLNMSKGAKVPEVPDIGDGKKHEWGDVVHKNTVTWLAKWKDSINGEDKCVWLSANSSWKGMSDMAKYEKARELKKHIAKVRADYKEGMASKDVNAQQRSVAVYLIDRLALRVGGEKDTAEEADTVGCCSLRVEHVKLDVPEPQLHLNFLGKDSIEYDNTNEVSPGAYKLIMRFMKHKKPTDQLFDRVVPSDLNDYFKSVMDGLSAKVFRTYNASITLCKELQKTDEQVTAEQRKRETDVVALCNYYTLANKRVAILCNHQKATSANHGEQIAKMDENIEKLKNELKELKKDKDKKAKAEQKQKSLDKAISARNTKDETKNVSLGTSKINYNDPRITIAWCKKHEVPIQKQFPKTLLAKFAWAMNTDPEYRF